jgi:hypothetical protein
LKQLGAVDRFWYQKLHDDFEASPYYFGKIGVAGTLFNLSDYEPDKNIKAWWREELVGEFNNNTTIMPTASEGRINTDIMGYDSTKTKWISDRNFYQWFRYLKLNNRTEKQEAIQKEVDTTKFKNE